MTVIANTLFHPRGCITICKSDTPCLCIMTFCISQRVGFNKNHLWLHYHEAPAADTSIASGFLGIEKERTCIVPHISVKAWKATTCIPLLPGGYFLSYVAFESWVKNVFRLFLCSHFESRWAFLENFDWDQCWERLKGSRLIFELSFYLYVSFGSSHRVVLSF